MTTQELAVKQTYTMYIYKRDRRFRTGERLFSTSVWQTRTLEGLEREMQEMARDLYRGTDWRFDFVPTTKQDSQ